MQELCIIASPRTGTNHIAAILRNCQKIKSRGEIFHPDFSEGLSSEEVKRLGHIAKKHFVNNRDQTLVTFVRSNPAALLWVLKDTDDGQCVNSFKIFPGHLTYEMIKNEIVSREHIHFMYVLRRPIDSFISNVKAGTIEKYFGIDTTAIRVKLNAAVFDRALRSWRYWYEKTSDMIMQSGQKYSTLLYETDIDCAIEQCFVNIKHAAILCGICPSAFDHAPGSITGLERQDRSNSYHEKVSNWDEFMQELHKRKLDRLAFSYCMPSGGRSRSSAGHSPFC